MIEKNTKLIFENILKDWTASRDTNRAVILRYFNPVGAHASGLLGEDPKDTPNNLMPLIVQTAQRKRRFLYIFGSDYDTRDGTGERDYIHVVDLAKAHVFAIKRLLEKNDVQSPEVFNIGTGKGVSILEVVKAFEEVSKIKLNYVFKDRREGDIVSAFADTSKANKVLGWKSELSLKDALASAWKWEKKIRN
mgnify:CR=1 FL=1